MDGVFKGFVDHHTHAVSYGIKKTRVDLSKTRSKSEALSLVREELEGSGKKIVIAEDWDETLWEEKEFPKKEELDNISGEKPIILRRICGHIAVGNTPAMDMIPDGYMVDKEKGIMYEDVVLYLNEIFKPDYSEIKEAILMMQEDFLSLGIVGINDICIPEYHRAYTELDRQGRILIKVKTFITDVHLDGINLLENTGHVELAGIKIFTDGSIGARTAAVKEFKYVDTDGNGILLKHREYIKEMIRFAEERGFVLAIHAIGDRAIGEVLAGFREYGDFNQPHRIEHFELATDDQIKEAVRMGIVLSMQPNFIKNWSLSGGLYEDAFGEKYKKNNRVGLILRSGGHIVFGSDGMPYSPVYGINSVVSAPFEEQRIGMEQAIELYTDVESENTEVTIKNDLVMETLIDGKIVFRRDDA